MDAAVTAIGNENTILSEIWDPSQAVRKVIQIYTMLCLICILILRHNGLTLKVVLCYGREGLDAEKALTSFRHRRAHIRADVSNPNSPPRYVTRGYLPRHALTVV